MRGESCSCCGACREACSARAGPEHPRPIGRQRLEQSRHRADQGARGVNAPLTHWVPVASSGTCPRSNTPVQGSLERAIGPPVCGATLPAPRPVAPHVPTQKPLAHTAALAVPPRLRWNTRVGESRPAASAAASALGHTRPRAGLAPALGTPTRPTRSSRSPSASSRLPPTSAVGGGGGSAWTPASESDSLSSTARTKAGRCASASELAGPVSGRGSHLARTHHPCRYADVEGCLDAPRLLCACARVRSCACISWRCCRVSIAIHQPRAWPRGAAAAQTTAARRAAAGAAERHARRGLCNDNVRSAPTSEALAHHGCQHSGNTHRVSSRCGAAVSPL